MQVNSFLFRGVQRIWPDLRIRTISKILTRFTRKNYTIILDALFRFRYEARCADLVGKTTFILFYFCLDSFFDLIGSRRSSYDVASNKAVTNSSSGSLPPPLVGGSDDPLLSILLKASTSLSSALLSVSSPS